MADVVTNDVIAISAIALKVDNARMRFPPNLAVDAPLSDDRLEI